MLVLVLVAGDFKGVMGLTNGSADAYVTSCCAPLAGGFPRTKGPGADSPPPMATAQLAQTTRHEVTTGANAERLKGSNNT
jgi:hypothetical protein